MKVIQTIQSTMVDPSEPVDITFYKGESLPGAMAAVADLMAGYDNDPRFTRTLSIRVEF